MFKQMGWNFHLLLYHSVNIKIAYGVFDVVADFSILCIAVEFAVNRKICSYSAFLIETTVESIERHIVNSYSCHNNKRKRPDASSDEKNIKN